MRASLKRIMLILVATAMAMIGSLSWAAAPAQAYTGTNVYFFTPHQDDEALFMGASIREHVLTGRHVFVVLLTDGGSSQYCANPNYPQWSPKANCVAARDAEFRAGVSSMGATSIIIPDRAVDGTLTAAFAKEVIERYVAVAPTGSFKTMSENDASSDHAKLGQGLNLAVGTVDKRWCLKYAEWGTRVGTFTAKYNINTTLDKYVFGKVSVPGDFSHATYPEGAFSKVYRH